MTSACEACRFGNPSASRTELLRWAASLKAAITNGTMTAPHAHPGAAALASDAGLAQRLEGAEAPEHGPAAAARLAWGLLLAQSGPETAQGVGGSDQSPV